MRQESWVIWHGQGLILMPGISQDFPWLSRAGRLTLHLAHPAMLSEKAQHKQEKGEWQDTHTSLTFDFQQLHTVLCKAPEGRGYHPLCTSESILQISWTYAVIQKNALWATQGLTSSEFDCSSSLPFNWNILRKCSERCVLCHASLGSRVSPAQRNRSWGIRPPVV